MFWLRNKRVQFRISVDPIDATQIDVADVLGRARTNK